MLMIGGFDGEFRRMVGGRRAEQDGMGRIYMRTLKSRQSSGGFTRLLR